MGRTRSTAGLVSYVGDVMVMKGYTVTPTVL